METTTRYVEVQRTWIFSVSCVNFLWDMIAPLKAHLTEFRWRNVYGKGTGDETLAILLQQMAELYPAPGE